MRAFYYCVRGARRVQAAHNLVRRAPGTLTRSLELRPLAKSFHNVAPLRSSELADELREEPKASIITKFAQLGENNMINRAVIDTLTKDMKLEDMTPIQAETINHSLGGTDVLAQAKTGTGKTIAFLLPVLQNILNQDPSLAHKSRGGRRRPDIRAIIISPTRELAEQIAFEARKVVRNTGVVVQTAVGGTQKLAGLKKIMYEGCHILVGTPGRLHDILSDPRNASIQPRNLSALVLDEADRLLDQGFAPEIQSIEAILPPKSERKRQTLMFSATVPEEVMDMVNSFMEPDYSVVRTVQEGEDQTHSHVPQHIVTAKGFENTLPSVIELCQRGLEAESELPFKAIVFFNTNAETALAANIFQDIFKPQRGTRDSKTPQVIVEMNSRLTQAARTRNSNAFRHAKSAIMLSSDVTARGLDFPNVTHVIQVGLPSSRDTYIHRLGRTARGSKPGEGWLILTPFEAREARQRLRDLKLNENDSLQSAAVDMTRDANIHSSIASTLSKSIAASQRADISLKNAAYKSSLGVYQWFSNKNVLITMLNNRSRFGWAMQSPPPISPQLASRLGLRRVAGLNIARTEPSESFAEDSAPHRQRSRFRSSSGHEGNFKFGEFAGRRSRFSRTPEEWQRAPRSRGSRLRA